MKEGSQNSESRIQNPEGGEMEDDGAERCVCGRCGGEGFIEYDDGDPSDWGEDCPSEVNHLIECRACRGTGRAD